MDVSIIIINYNTLQLTSACIDSIIKHTKRVSYEIILVDNASTDGSSDLFSTDFRIKYIQNKCNYGFGKANNIGAESALGKYLFLINSDTLLIEDSISHMFDYMECNLDTASCGVNLIDYQLNDSCCHGKFPSLLNEFSKIGFYIFYKKYFDKWISTSQKIFQGNINDVDYISGADIFIRKDIFEEFGGFDTIFFMYYEETDLYFRMKQKGYHSKILSDSSIIHLEGASFSEEKDVFNIKRFEMQYTSKIKYFVKHKRKYQVILVKLFTLLSILSHPHVYKGYNKQLIYTIINTK